VVRFRHLPPVAAPARANVGIIRTTSNLLDLVELLNLTFEQEPGRKRDSNVKFAPLEPVQCFDFIEQALSVIIAFEYSAYRE